MLASKMNTLTPEQLTRVHEATLEVLKNTGVVFEDEEALALFKKHGARVEGDVVFFPPKMVEEAIEATPSSFMWHGRDRQYSIGVGEGHPQVIGPTVSVVNILEDDGTRRPGEFRDSVNFMKLNQASEVIQIVGMNTVEPNDIPPNERHLRLCYEALKNSSKPLLNYTVMNNKQQAIDVLRMVEMVTGSLDEVYIGHTMCPFSPLKYEGPVIEVLKEFLKRGQPIFIAPCALSGLTAPVDLLGSVVLQNAEDLAMVTFVHLFSPGTPLVMHASNSSTYMAKATMAWASPESQLICISNVQLCKDLYHIPSRTIGAVSVSKKVDYQAGMETMQNLMVALLSDVDFSYINSGGIENLVTMSFAKYIMDDELISRVQCIRKGVPFSEEMLSVKDIHEVGHGGSYLFQKATIKRCRERWSPLVSNWNTASKFEEDILANANKLLQQRLENAPETFLDSAVDKELQAFVNKRLSEL